MPTVVKRKAAVVPAAISRFLSILDLTHDDLGACLRQAADFKKARRTGARHERPLEGRHVALLFEKPSLRTRSTSQIAIRELGGDVIEPPQDVALGGRETIADVARNLERWVHAAVVRTYAQTRLEEFAAAAPSLHVVNALTDDEHPCQALADCLTLIEKFGGDVRGRTVAFVGDGNNVAASLGQAATMLGINVTIASPAGFELKESIRKTITGRAKFGATLVLTDDPIAAVKDVDAVYTDVWTSMGQESEAADRRALFEPFQVNAELMSHAAPD